MAKHEDDFSFDFTSKKPDKKSDLSSAETPADAFTTPDSEPTEESDAGSPNPTDQFHILILADFSGRTNRSLSEPTTLASRKVHTVDADNLARVMAALKPEIHLAAGETAIVPLKFQSPDNFRPDALLAQVEAFSHLLALRRELADATSFQTAAEKARKLFGEASPSSSVNPQPKAASPTPSDAPAAESEFEKLLQRSSPPKSQSSSAGPPAQALIANLVAGYGLPDADPQQAQFVQLVDDALSAGLRAVLRHPAFQAVEAAWRGVEFLVSRLNTDGDLKIRIFDLSRDELRADLMAAATIQQSALYQVLVEKSRIPGAVPYSLIVGDYTFSQDPQDIALLAKVATLAHEARAPFLAAAAPAVAGVASFAELAQMGKWQPPNDIAQWEKIRSYKHAAALGLAAPSFLLRLPYGPKTDAIDAFPFDEMPGPPLPAAYLWGNPAFALALAIGQGFLNGSPADPDLDIADLPCHMATVDGDREMTPCAQAWLSDRNADILHQLGIIPLLSVRNAAAVKIAGIHSLSIPSKPLAAAWAT